MAFTTCAGDYGMENLKPQTRKASNPKILELLERQALSRSPFNPENLLSRKALLFFCKNPVSLLHCETRNEKPYMLTVHA